MSFVEFAFGITFISIVMGGLVKIAGRIFGTRGKASAAELSAAQERIRSLEMQLLDSHRQNEQLQKQLDWHAKLLETQDRFVKQLASAS
jgi:hypothetical protein